MLEQIWRNMPPVVKNLLLINLLMFFATLILASQGIDLEAKLGLYNFFSSEFEPYQVVTHMFMHSSSSFFHIFFYMFALISFGTILEKIWGPKRFLLYYFITGFGAVFLYSLVNYFEYSNLISMLTSEEIEAVKTNGLQLLQSNQNFVGTLGELNVNLFIPMVGASGAIYGLLVAFGLLFPNTELSLLFIPIPIKAKYLIPGLIVIEYFAGVSDIDGDNIAHFAHLGGALIGFILVKIWSKDRNNFY